MADYTKSGFKKPLSSENYNIRDQNENWDTAQKLFDLQREQIRNLSTPYVIPKGENIAIEDRVNGKLYFKVTDTQTDEVEINNDIIKVSATMGMKINGVSDKNVRVNPIMGIKIE